MTRRCSHCSNNGHNSRTCPTRGGGGGGSCGGGGGFGGLKLFGVRLTDGSFMKKSKSMGNLNLSHYHSNNSPNPSSPSSDHLRDADADADADADPDTGYLSDDPNHASCSSNRRSERKKGKPWTEEEHRLFLIGLQKLGKGDWRGIARNYVVSRTPTQVASHAQKYFIRQSNATRRKRRSSLFDMVPDMVTEEPRTVREDQLLPLPAESRELDNTNSLPSTDLSLSREPEPHLEPEIDPMEATSTQDAKENRETIMLHGNLAPTVPTFFLPFPYPQFWPHTAIKPEQDNKEQPSLHQVLKPTPVLRKAPVNVDDLVGMSRLNLSETENGHIVPPQLSLGLLGTPSRQSAFHVSAPAASSAELNDGKNSAIQAV